MGRKQKDVKMNEEAGSANMSEEVGSANMSEEAGSASMSEEAGSANIKRRVTRSMKQAAKKPPMVLKVVNKMDTRGLDPRLEPARRRAAMEERMDETNQSLEPNKIRKVAGGKSRLSKKVERGAGSNKGRKKAVGEVAAIAWEEEQELRGQFMAPAMALEANAKVDYQNPPAGVLGAGKGTEQGLPEYEFRSVWQNTLPELNAKNPAPWNQDPARPPPDLIPTILSVVASVSLGSALDLNDIAKRGSNLNYDPESFTPMVMRLRNPKATALIFKSGKMVVTGTKSVAECRTATRRIARIIQKLGNRVQVQGMVIQNISATCNLGFRVRVHLFGGDKLLSNQIGYHPELFTGVSIPLVKPKVKVMIFRTGSILITGAKAEAELQEALTIVYPFAKMYAN